MYGIGAFGQGLVSGMSSGEDIQTKMRARQQAARQQAAQQQAGQIMLANYLKGQQQQPPPNGPQPPGGPGPAPGPAGAGGGMAGGPPGMTTVPMPGATPMPGSGGPGPQMPQPPAPAGPPGPIAGPPMPSPRMPAPGPQGAPARPPGPAPMSPGMPGPQGPPGGPGAGGGGPSLSGIAAPTGQGEVADMQKTVQAIAAPIIQANPKIKGLQLFDAVQAQLAVMKGLQPEMRDAAMLQVKLIQAETEAQKAAAQAQHYGDLYDIAQKKLDEQQKQLDAYAAAQAGHDRARVDTAEIGAGARKDAASKGLQGRKYAADRGVDAASVRADATRDASGTGADARVTAADKAARTAAAKAYLSAVTSGNTSKPTPDQLATYRGMLGGNDADARRRPSVPDGGGSPAGTQQNPARPKSRSEAAALPTGTWFVDPTGAVLQKH